MHLGSWMAWWFEDVCWGGTEGCGVKPTESKNLATLLEKNSEVILSCGMQEMRVQVLTWLLTSHVISGRNSKGTWHLQKSSRKQFQSSQFLSCGFLNTSPHEHTFWDTGKSWEQIYLLVWGIQIQWWQKAMKCPNQCSQIRYSCFSQSRNNWCLRYWIPTLQKADVKQMCIFLFSAPCFVSHLSYQHPPLPHSWQTRVESSVLQHGMKYFMWMTPWPDDSGLEELFKSALKMMY